MRHLRAIWRQSGRFDTQSHARFDVDASHVPCHAHVRKATTARQATGERPLCPYNTPWRPCMSDVSRIRVHTSCSVACVYDSPCPRRRAHLPHRSRMLEFAAAIAMMIPRIPLRVWRDGICACASMQRSHVCRQSGRLSSGNPVTLSPLMCPKPSGRSV